jgi:hypothetical protein
MIAKDLQLIRCKTLHDHGPVGGGIAGLAGESQPMQPVIRYVGRWRAATYRKFHETF